ncbi:sensor histidine kinase [Gaetbulibacter jejuensis]|uniref:sensor histidine kinase n=1 Tax=Gaetbulibacter jejuensis TaxID=584607 RepID=UPI0031E27FB3
MIFFLQLLLGCSIYAQEFTIKKIDANHNGGSAVNKKALYIDDDGFLWYSTKGGVVKEHGTNSIFFNISNPIGFIDPPQVNQIFKSKSNFLWIATSHGAYSLNLSTGKGTWVETKIPEHSKVIDVYSIFEDNIGNIWLGTEIEFVFKVSIEGEVLPVKLIDNLFFKNMVYGDRTPINTFINPRIKFLGHNDKECLVISQMGVLSEINVLTLEQRKIVDINKQSKVRTHKDWLLVDKSALDFLCFTSLGYYQFQKNTYTYSYIDELDKFYVEVPFGSELLQMNEEGKVYFVKTNDRSLILYSFLSKKEGVLLLKNNEFKFDYPILNTHVSKSGIILTNTQEGKICFLKRKVSMFKKYLYSSSTKIKGISCRNIVETSNRDILIYTYNGFFRRADNTGYFKKIVGLPPSLISSFHGFYMENDSIIWGFGYSHFVSRININKKTFKSFKLKVDTLSQTTTFRDAIVLNRDLFLLNAKGLYSINMDSFKFNDLNQLSKDINIEGIELKELFIDSKNENLWIGSVNGVYKKNLKTQQAYHFHKNTKPIQLVSNEVNVIFEDKKKNIWLGTDNGLQKIDVNNNTSQVFSENTPFKGNKVTGIIEDNNNLWISTFNGLVKFNTTHKVFQVFFKENGLTNNEFNFNSYLKSSSGEVFFGGIDGLNGFYPYEILKRRNSFKLFLNQYKVYNKDSQKIDNHYLNVSEINSFTLPYNYNYLSLDFSINDISNISGNTYQYRLVNNNQNWIDIGSSGKIQFQGLKPGKYILEVRGISSLGDYTNTLSYTIVSKEIFYKSPFFIISIFFLIVSYFYYINKKSRQRLKKDFHQKIKMMELKSKAFRSQMNPHFLFNSLNGIQNAIISKGEKEANNYINHFSKILRHTLNISNLEFISLIDEIDYLKSYVELTKIKLNDDIIVNFNVKNDIESQILIPCMLFQPIVENAIIHGLMPKKGEKSLEITFQITQTSVVGTVLDNGIGIEASKKKKKRLQHNKKSWATVILKERIEIFNTLNKDKIQFSLLDRKTLENTSGTRVVISIPLILQDKINFNLQNYGNN